MFFVGFNCFLLFAHKFLFYVPSKLKGDNHCENNCFRNLLFRFLFLLFQFKMNLAIVSETKLGFQSFLKDGNWGGSGGFLDIIFICFQLLYSLHLLTPRATNKYQTIWT